MQKGTDDTAQDTELCYRYVTEGLKCRCFDRSQIVSRTCGVL